MRTVVVIYKSRGVSEQYSKLIYLPPPSPSPSSFSILFPIPFLQKVPSKVPIVTFSAKQAG